MSEDANIPSEFYGDEQARLKELQRLSYADFKQQLLDIHNTLPDVVPEDHFVTRQNETWGASSTLAQRIKIIY